MRKLSLTLLFVLFSVFVFSTIAFASPQVILNGQALTFDTPPVTEQGCTLVPLRAIFEALGTSVKWDAPAQTTKELTSDQQES